MRKLNNKLHSRGSCLVGGILILLVLFALNLTIVNAISEWAPGVAYKIGDIVTYQGSTYKCIQAHTSLTGWEPHVVPALWTLYSGPVSTPTPTPRITPTPTPRVTSTPTPRATPTPIVSPIPTTTPNPSLPKHIMVGYWHNFDNGLSAFIKLRNISTKWDVVDVSFAETAGDRATAIFTPFNATDADFQADVAYLKSLGKKVVLSIGGQNGVVMLSNNTLKQSFINSMIALIDKYGFNGIDLDVETGLSLAPGDTDFKNPTTPNIVNLIAAVRTICDHYGANFILSMAPQIADVQGGIIAYATNWGAYLPIIYELRDKLTYVHVQHYNCGGNTALDGRNYNQGTADFQVAMAEMLLHGFPIAGNTNNQFPALRPDQVVIGIPACPSAAPSGGYISPTDMKKALDYLIKGISYGGTYKLINTSGYSGFRGLMTWSVNWDATSGGEFSNNYRPYLNSLP